jgi:enterobactin synthetase component D
VIDLAPLTDLVDEGLAASAWVVTQPTAARRTRIAGPLKRSADYRRGRDAAARALHRAGHPSAHTTVIRADADGCPVWPHGFVGSISHSDSIAVAVAVRRESARSVGIDVEAIRTRSRDFFERVMRPEDHRSLPAGQSLALTATAFFSIREAVYKCVFPIVRQRMDWFDCGLSVDWNTRTFAARILTDVSTARPGELFGRFRSTDDTFASVCWWQHPGTEHHHNRHSDQGEVH